MGPITLFDKSFLQSLSLDEAVWFDYFFLTNICPLFFVETLADLEKAVRAGRTPEHEVGNIAYKTPEMNSSPNVFHIDLCVASLHGEVIPMDGRIIVAGGRPVNTADGSGIFIHEPPEKEAFSRWQKGEFLDVERQFAKVWRRLLRTLDVKKISHELKFFGIEPEKCKTLNEAKTIAQSFVSASDLIVERMKFMFSILNLPNRILSSVVKKWTSTGKSALDLYAPYAAYVFNVVIFYYLAATTELISVKCMADIAYLFYLPFSMIFISSDRIHRRCAPFFMRKNQGFIWGEDLKYDLQRINQYYDSFPESEKKKGLYSIAKGPPTHENFLVTKLWDRFLPTWRSSFEKKIPSNIKKEDKIVQKIEKIREKITDEAKNSDFGLSEPDFMVLEKRIRKRKGKWWQLPSDLHSEDN